MGVTGLGAAAYWVGLDDYRDVSGQLDKSTHTHPGIQLRRQHDTFPERILYIWESLSGISHQNIPSWDSMIGVEANFDSQSPISLSFVIRISFS